MTTATAHRIVAVSRHGALFTTRVFGALDRDMAAMQLLNNFYGAGSQIRTVEVIDADAPRMHGETNLEA